MRWARANVDPMLALRTVVANDRWDEAWTQVRAHTRRLTAAQRQHRRQTRQAAAPPPHTPTVLPAAPAPPPPPRAPRHTGAIPAVRPERARRPHPWSYQARLNARSFPTARANF